MANPPFPVDQPKPGPRVAAYMRVVANGVTANGRAKATLIVTPRSPAQGEETVDLAEWPGAIVAFLAKLDKPDKDGKKNKFPVFLSPTDPTNAPDLSRADNPRFVALANDKDGLDAVNKLWREAIEGTHDNTPWDTLLADIDRSVKGEKSAADLQQAYNYGTNDSPDALMDNGALIARAHDPKQQTIVKGVVPNPQTGYAVDTEAGRSQRLIRKLQIGPYLPGDQTIIDKEVPNPNLSKETVADQRKKVLYDRLKASIDDPKVKEQRARSYKDFQDVKNKLVGGNPPPPAPALRLPIAPAAQVLGKSALANLALGDMAADRPSRAGQVYGSWAQWSPQYRDAYKAAADRAAATGTPQPTQKPSRRDPQATMHSIYYSLQGDPILSRLFGFAFDIEFDFPNRLASGADVWLVADDPSKIWTRARYLAPDGASKDKTKRFWPAPRFEDANASPALSREQIHGVFDLGQGYYEANRQPRYQLTSLAVRGAVSEALGEDGIEALDKGERHQTVGWTLLDSGRAAQTARDLAVANHQRKAQSEHKAVVLHAEELTIGRRLDVKAVGPKQKNVRWRSLMNRFVEFTNLKPAAKKRLDAIVADRMQKGKILDEAAFQLVSRSFPIVGDDGKDTDKSRNVEAVVEEAFQSWDGTPLATLACKSTANGSGTTVLPVKRAYDLPASDFPDLRPPPLRYGVGYIFSIRAEFVGGGSPSLGEAASWHDAQDGKTTLPPSNSNIAKPRRFLRHEAIGAPILMLPNHLITERNKSMGFEPPARAVVRTTTPPDNGEDDPGHPGPDYIKPADRALPDSTMRIFVAPMAGLDFCARHGVFDNPNQAKQRLGGGLLDVEFNTDPKTLGFPVAVVKRNTGFNADRLIYRREPGPPGKKPDENEGFGATIFKPLGKPAPRQGGRGYLPDPAAQTMSLRLRVTGSDKYLKGDVLVELYPNKWEIDYPQTLPLVINVEKKKDQRAKPATSVEEVLVGDPKAIFRQGGVRVRRLSVVLAPGEQFDLEATCLPSEAKLAEWFSLPETIGVQHLLATRSDAAARTLCAACGEAPVGALKAALGIMKAADRTGLAGYAPPDDSGLGSVAQEVLKCIRNRWRLSEVAGVTTLRVEHAVSAPQKAVSLEKTAVARPDLKKLNNKDDASNTPGSPTLMLTGEILADLEQVDTIDIVAEVVNPGGKPFDDPARGRGVLNKRAGHWPTVLSGEGKRQYSRKRAVLGFDVDPVGKTTLLPEMVTVLRIQNLPDPRAAVNNKEGPKVFLDPPGARLTRIDLGVLYAAALKGRVVEIPVASDGHPEQSSNPVAMRTIGVTRPHEISDTRARFLKLHTVATSRFARSFETAPMFSADAKEHVLHRRQPLHDRDQCKTGGSIEAWSQATTRPPPAAAKTPMPFFAIKRWAKKDGGVVVQSLVRKCGVRLRFERRMFASGEGERIGIVVWPPDIKTQTPCDLEQNTVKVGGRTMTLDQFQDGDLGDGGQYISRWGGDPIRSDPEPQKSWFMPPTAFAYLNPAESSEPQPHDPEYIASVSMPIGAAKPVDSGGGNASDSEPVTFLKVSLLTFEPYFDIDAEEWFVDVAMDPARATDPFIRLGLVRYQPNAISDDLKVSTPVRVWTQLPPRRTLTVHSWPAKNGDLLVKGVVCGQASDGIKPLPDDAQYLLNSEEAKSVWERLQRPKMLLNIVHETEDEDYGKHQTAVFPNESICFEKGDIVNGEMQWSVSRTVPVSRLNELGPGQCVAIVEEVEERLPATYPNEPIKITDLLREEVVRRSGPKILREDPLP